MVYLIYNCLINPIIFCKRCIIKLYGGLGLKESIVAGRKKNLPGFKLFFKIYSSIKASVVEMRELRTETEEGCLICLKGYL